MDFSKVLEFVLDHIDGVLAILTLVGTYVGVDILKARKEFRKDTWEKAAHIAFESVELAKDLGVNTTKVDKALDIAGGFMQAFKLAPSASEIDMWKAVWENRAATEKLMGNPLAGGVSGDSGNAPNLSGTS